MISIARFRSARIWRRFTPVGCTVGRRWSQPCCVGLWSGWIGRAYLTWLRCAVAQFSRRVLPAKPAAHPWARERRLPVVAQLFSFVVDLLSPGFAGGEEIS